VDYLVAGTTAM